MKKKSKITATDTDNFLDDIKIGKNEAIEIIKKAHLDVETTQKYLLGELKDQALIVLENHLSVCNECRQNLEELKESMAVIDEYEPIPQNIQVPDKILKAIPKPQATRNTFVKLSFNADSVLEKIEGVVKSMGGILDSLADFTIEALTPDEDYILETRGSAGEVKDFRTQYKTISAIFSDLPEEQVLEAYVKIDGISLEDLIKLDFEMMDKNRQRFQADSKEIVGDSLKLVFSNLDLKNKAYEFILPLQPIPD